MLQSGKVFGISVGELWIASSSYERKDQRNKRPPTTTTTLPRVWLCFLLLLTDDDLYLRHNTRFYHPRHHDLQTHDDRWWHWCVYGPKLNAEITYVCARARVILLCVCVPESRWNRYSQLNCNTQNGGDGRGDAAELQQQWRRNSTNAHSMRLLGTQTLTSLRSCVAWFERGFSSTLNTSVCRWTTKGFGLFCSSISVKENEMRVSYAC